MSEAEATMTENGVEESNGNGTTSDDNGLETWQKALIVVGVLALIGGGVMWWRNRKN